MAFLDNLKDRLGFGGEAEEEFDEELYGDSYDQYAEEFESDYEEESNDTGYSSFTPLSTRSSAGRRSRASRDRSTNDGPQLISLEDVRNTTRIPESLQRDPLPPRRGENYGRNSVGHAADFARSGSEHEQSTSSTVGADVASGGGQRGNAEGGTAKPSSEIGMGTHPGSSSGYDPYRAYETGGASSHRPTRSISVISPQAYGEVENVARMLRAGDAVVLSLRNTPSQLSKRILDFSFGVASALDATVDCIADKVFAITRGSSLNEDELSRLRNQGVI